jgi:hypothetical protein
MCLHQQNIEITGQIAKMDVTTTDILTFKTLRSNLFCLQLKTRALDKAGKSL